MSLEPYRSILPQEQEPKSQNHFARGSRRPKGTLICNRCRRDTPQADIHEGYCPDCQELTSQEVAVHRKRIVAYQDAEVAAGRAYYDSAGHFYEI